MSDLADIKTLTNGDLSSLREHEPALKNYNEGQFATVKLPGGSKEVCIDLELETMMDCSGRRVFG